MIIHWSIHVAANGIISFFLWLSNIPYIHTHIATVAQMVKNLPAMQETRVQSLGWEDSLKKEMATYFSILAWRIPWTEELGELHTVHGVARSDTTEQLTFSPEHRGSSLSFQIKSFSPFPDICPGTGFNM